MTEVIHTSLISPSPSSCSEDNGNNEGIISLYENVLTPQEAASYLDLLTESLPWATLSDNFGTQSRPTCYFGNDTDCIFSYVGLRLKPKPWPESLRALRTKVAQACSQNNTQKSTPDEIESLLTACLANLYSKSADHHIPWHYDEVRAHGERRIVASLSLGGPRRFSIRKRGQEQVLVDIDLPSGSVLWMEGRTQELYEHCLPKQSDGEQRVSLTFRSIVPGYELDKEIAVDICCT